MDLQVFNYNQKQIRTSVNEKGETLFVASDVCESLSLDNIGQALARIDDQDKDNIIINDAIGRQRKISVINESGLYALIFTSHKEEAKKFKRWVTSEVLPSIRKTGSFGESKFNLIPKSVEMLKSIDAAASIFGLTGNQKILSVNRATREITNVDFQQLLGIELVNDTQEIQLSPTEIGKELGSSAKKVNKLLQEKNLQVKDINNNWVPTLQGSKLAVILDVGKKHSNGTPITQLKWKQSVINELRQ